MTCGGSHLGTPLQDNSDLNFKQLSSTIRRALRLSQSNRILWHLSGNVEL